MIQTLDCDTFTFFSRTFHWLHLPPLATFWNYQCRSFRVTAIPGNKPGAVRDREHLSREVPPGKPLPGTTYLRENLPGTSFPGKVDPGGPSRARSFPGKEGRFRSRSTPEVVPGQGHSRGRKVVPGSGPTPEVVPGQGQLVPGVFPLPSHLFPGIAVTQYYVIGFGRIVIKCWRIIHL